MRKSGDSFGLLVWLVADGCYWFVVREKYGWLVTGGWFVLREKYCWLVVDKPSEQGGSLKISDSIINDIMRWLSWGGCFARQRPLYLSLHSLLHIIKNPTWHCMWQPMGLLACINVLALIPWAKKYDDRNLRKLHFNYIL
jgi:hypothetical protein